MSTLTEYEVLDKELFKRLERQFRGIIFHREENGKYFIKLPSLYMSEELLNSGLIK